MMCSALSVYPLEGFFSRPASKVIESVVALDAVQTDDLTNLPIVDRTAGAGDRLLLKVVVTALFEVRHWRSPLTGEHGPYSPNDHKATHQGGHLTTFTYSQGTGVGRRVHDLQQNLEKSR